MKKIAGNQLSMTKSFLSAESGLIEGYNFFEKNYIKYWGMKDKAILEINKLSNKNDSTYWLIKDIIFTEETVEINSCGYSIDQTAERCLSMVYQKPKGGSELDPLVFNNLINPDTLNTANSNQFNIVGQITGYDSFGRPIYAPAIATNNEKNKEILIKDIEKKQREDNYKGGVELVNYDGAFGDPEKMNEFVENIKEQWNSMSNKNPLKGNALNEDFGTVDNPKITYHEGNLDLRGNMITGYGILVIRGNLEIRGNNFNFNGLIIVTGKSFVVRGGGSSNKKMFGAIVFANPTKVNNEWTFGGVEATFDFNMQGGAASFIYDRKKLEIAHSLLNEHAKSLWKFEKLENADRTGGIKSKVFNWKEVI